MWGCPRACESGCERQGRNNGGLLIVLLRDFGNQKVYVDGRDCTYSAGILLHLSPGERVFYVDSIFPARTAVGEKLALHPPRLVV